MNKLIIVAALGLSLAACDQAAEESDDVATADTPAATADTPAATETVAADSSAGTYEYTFEGKQTVSTLMTDGMYSDTQDGKVVEQGKWADKDGKVCFDPDGDNPEVCWTTTEPDPDGVFTATSDDGKTVLTIRKTA